MLGTPRRSSLKRVDPITSSRSTRSVQREQMISAAIGIGSSRADHRQAASRLRKLAPCHPSLRQNT